MDTVCETAQRAGTDTDLAWPHSAVFLPEPGACLGTGGLGVAVVTVPAPEAQKETTGHALALRREEPGITGDLHLLTFSRL